MVGVVSTQSHEPNDVGDRDGRDGRVEAQHDFTVPIDLQHRTLAPEQRIVDRVLVVRHTQLARLGTRRLHEASVLLALARLGPAIAAVLRVLAHAVERRWVGGSNEA
tara:strand:+ start:852 stop:1172 length:321 start_codon:yes stop_codon:yes gene_type:complete